jgi:hypothetical protein
MYYIHKISEAVMIVSIILILFFGTGLDSEGYTCLTICAVTLVPLIISMVIWYLTQTERRA